MLAGEEVGVVGLERGGHPRPGVGVERGAAALGWSPHTLALATWALAISRRILPPEIRGQEGVPFGPVVEVPADAGPYAQLAAWLGRHP